MATTPTQPLVSLSSTQATHTHMERRRKTAQSVMLMIIPIMMTAMAGTITMITLTIMTTAMLQSGRRPQQLPALASATLCMLGGALSTLRGKQHELARCAVQAMVVWHVAYGSLSGRLPVSATSLVKFSIRVLEADVHENMRRPFWL